MGYPEHVSDEARRIHEDAIIIDACSFFLEGYNESIGASGITALNITVPDTSDDSGEAVKHIADYYEVVRRDPKLTLIETAGDIRAAKREGKVGVIIGFQNSRPFSHYFLESMVEVFRRLGARVVILAYNYRNFAADGCVEDPDGGLSSEGRKLIDMMNRAGIVIDCSHTGIRSSLEAIEISRKPCVFSHSNPKALSRQKRNITDEQIRAVAARGGVIGLTPFPPMNWNGEKIVPSIDSFLDSVDYVVKMVGIDHVGLGTDKEATPGAYPRELIMRELETLPHSVGDYYGTFAGNFDAVNLAGFPSVAFLPRFTQGLMDRGYGEDDIRKFLGLNFLRVFEEVWHT